MKYTLHFAYLIIPQRHCVFDGRGAGIFVNCALDGISLMQNIENRVSIVLSDVHIFLSIHSHGSNRLQHSRA